MSARATKHGVILILVLAFITATHFGVLAAQARAYETMRDASAASVPTSFGGYARAGADSEIPQNWMDTLQTKNILMRNYRGPSGRYVNLTIVVAGASRRSLHFPEVCLRGQGNEIREQYVAPVGVSFMARHLVLVEGGNMTAVIYWFKVGDRFTDSFFVNSMHWALGQLTLSPAKSAMIKLSTAIGLDGEDAAFRELESFAETIEPILRETL